MGTGATYDIETYDRVHIGVHDCLCEITSKTTKENLLAKTASDAY